MATASLEAMHTACVRLRDSLDRWLAAFEVMAHEAAASGVVKTEPARKTLRSQSSVKIIALAGSDRGITAAELQRLIDMAPRSAGARLSILASRGHLVRVALPGQTVRYFAHAEHATAWGASGGPAEPEPADTREVLEVGLRQAPQQLAAMVEASAPAVERALQVLAPQPAAAHRPAVAAPPPAPTVAQRHAGWAAKAQNEAAARAVPPPPLLEPKGEVVVPPDVKRTVVNAPAYDLRFGVDPKAVSADPESFSAQWKRLRGEGPSA